MRIPPVLFLAISILALPVSGQAQGVEPGAVVTPKADLTLRDAPPGGLIGLKGDAIGSVTPTMTFKVIDKRTISTILGGENWLKVQGVDDASKQGWVFGGTKSEPIANINVKAR